MKDQKPLSFTPEEVARLKARTIDAEEKSNLTPENLMVAEFGILYGYEGVRAVLNDEIGMSTMLWLLEAGRRVKSIDRYNDTQARFIASVSAQSKDPVKTIKSLTGNMKKEADGIRI